MTAEERLQEAEERLEQLEDERDQLLGILRSVVGSLTELAILAGASTRDRRGTSPAAAPAPPGRRAVTPAERLVERLIREARATATTYAVRRLLERRPDLRPPAALPDLPVLVPGEEDAAYSLDRLDVMAWIARQVDLAVEVDVRACLRAGISWRLLAKALRLPEEQTRERYGHLASGTDRQEGDQPS